MGVEVKGYLMHEFINGRIAVCRILKEYEPEEIKQAKDDFISVSTGFMKEEEFEKE